MFKKQTYPCLLHQHDVARKICLTPDCQYNKLSCEKCLDHPCHKGHTFEELHSYIDSLINSQKKTKEHHTANVTKIEELKSHVQSNVNNTRKYINNLFGNLGASIDTTFQKILTQLVDQQKRTLTIIKELPDTLQQQGSKETAQRLDALFKEIHCEKQVLDQVVKEVENVSFAIDKYLQRVKSDMDDNLKPLSGILKKPDASKLKIHFNPNNNNNIGLSQVNNTKSPILHKSRSKSSPRQKSLTSITIVTLGNTTSSDTRSITQILFSLGPGTPKWSEELKGSKIKVEGEVVTRTDSSGCNNGVVVALPGLIPNKSLMWALRFNKCTNWICVGVCLKKVVMERNLSYGNIKNLGHGYYALGSNGHTYSHHDMAANNKEVVQSFGRNREVLTMLFDGAHNKLTFRVNGGKSNLCELKLEDPGEDQYCFFGFIFQEDNEIELMPKK